MISTNSTKTFSFYYDLIEGSPVRRQLGKARPNSNCEMSVIEVLVNEDASGSYLNSVRGLIMPGRDQSRIGLTTDQCHPRPFNVNVDLMLAIGRDLGLGLRVQPPLRLATLHGKHVD